MEDIRAKANINIVTCGNCGSIILHEMKSINEDNSI
jgi:transcription elongation factor Elf1